AEERAALSEAASQELEKLQALNAHAPQKPQLKPLTSPKVEEILFEIKKLEIVAKTLDDSRNEKVAQIQRALDGLRQQKSQAEYALKKVPEYQASILAKERDLQHLEARKCFTCKQK